VSTKKIKEYINSDRRDFSNQPFNIDMAHQNPFVQYQKWFEQAVENKILDPYAACLSTVDSSGKPSSRILYIRDLVKDGFIFYTNFNSNKGSDIETNNCASLNVFWGVLERQIRIQGVITKVAKSTSDKYFNSRPRASQIGAWSSDQSKEINNRKELEDKVSFFEKKFENKIVPRPPHWGGYCLKPTLIEFWQGRSSRLHDRIVYTKENNKWHKSRLSP